MIMKNKKDISLIISTHEKMVPTRVSRQDIEKPREALIDYNSGLEVWTSVMLT
jgi:hypothetical protein